MPRTRVTYPCVLSFQCKEEQKLELMTLGHFWGNGQYASVIRYMIDNYIPQIKEAMTAEQLARYNAIKRNLAIEYQLTLGEVAPEMQELLNDEQPAPMPEFETQGETDHDEPNERPSEA